MVNLPLFAGGAVLTRNFDQCLQIRQGKPHFCLPNPCANVKKLLLIGCKSVSSNLQLVSLLNDQKLPNKNSATHLHFLMLSNMGRRNLIEASNKMERLFNLHQI